MKKLMTLSLIVASFGLTGCKSLQDYMQDTKNQDPKDVVQSKEASKKMPAEEKSSKSESQPSSGYSRKMKKVSDASIVESNKSQKEPAESKTKSGMKNDQKSLKTVGNDTVGADEKSKVKPVEEKKTSNAVVEKTSTQFKKIAIETSAAKSDESLDKKSDKKSVEEQEAIEKEEGHSVY